VDDGHRVGGVHPLVRSSRFSAIPFNGHFEKSCLLAIMEML